jgi:hypothetical protein
MLEQRYKIGIITPTLNRPHFIEMLSIMLSEQTVHNFKHYIIEESFSYNQHKQNLQNSKFIIIDSDVPVSISKKMNYGLSKINTCDIIFKMDSDNYFGPRYIEKYIRYMHNHPECKLSFTKEDILYNISEREYGILKVVQDGNICFRSDILQKVAFRESFGVGELGEDAWWIWDTESGYGKHSVQQVNLDIYSDYMVIKHVPKLQKFIDYKNYKPIVLNEQQSKERIINGQNLCTYDVSNIQDNNLQLLKKIVTNQKILEFYKGFYKNNV